MSELEGKTILVLGGAGQVGFEICKKTLEKNPTKLIVCSLKKTEVESAVKELEKINKKSAIRGEWGNIFVREEIKDKTLKEIAENKELSEIIVKDVFSELDENILENATLFKIITKHKPNIIVDSINTATALAYQDVYTHATEDRKDKWIYLAASLELPQLVRHNQILVNAFKNNPVEQFLKVGTGGTGGLGLTLPFTKGENEIPSRLVMSKSAVAGAQTMLLWVLGRTPGMPIVKEIKVTALIGWRAVKKGKIITKRGAVELYDCPLENALPIEKALEENRSIRLGKKLEGVWIDTGENDIYTRDMFEALSSPSLMGLITPVEVDEVASISTLGPLASKILLEAQILRSLFNNLNDATKCSAKEIEEKALELIRNKQNLRVKIISIGIPILLPNGKILRGPDIRIPRIIPKYVTVKNIENWTGKGWVDLRQKNWILWQNRLSSFKEHCQQQEQKDTNTIGAISAWVFAYEKGGLRLKE